VRLNWVDLPAHIHTEVETRLGARVVEAVSHSAGFSPGLASRLRTADGNDVFVKAVSGVATPHSVDIHRREARIAAALPADVSAPRLRWSFDDGDWVVLAFDFVAGHTPELPWRSDDLDRVLAAMIELAGALTPSPIATETAEDVFGDALRQWRTFPDDPGDLARLAPPWRHRLDDLVELEGRWAQATRGSSLLHLDVRADNLLLTGDGVCFTDWPWAATGAPWLDLVAFLPSVAMQGGPDPESVWRAHPWSRDVDDEAVDALVAAFAGFLTRNALRPPPPSLPTLRAFQAAQGVTARAWLAQRRGWTDALDC